MNRMCVIFNILFYFNNSGCHYKQQNMLGVGKTKYISLFNSHFMNQISIINPNRCGVQLMNEQYRFTYPINHIVTFDMKQKSQILNSVNFIRKFKQ